MANKTPRIEKTEAEKVASGRAKLQHRVQLTLNNLDVLAKAPRSRLYKPTSEDTEKIFGILQERLDYVKALFEGNAEAETLDFSL